MKIQVSYTKRVDQQNWAHGSRRVEANSPEEAEAIVAKQLKEEGKNALCISATRTYKLETI